MSALEIWTVYDHPSDYPDAFVARLHLVHADAVEPTDLVVSAPTLPALRLKLPPGLSCLTRDPTDDPCIVESWL